MEQISVNTSTKTISRSTNTKTLVNSINPDPIKYLVSHKYYTRNKTVLDVDSIAKA